LSAARRNVASDIPASEAKRWINFRAHHPEPGGPKELFGFPDC
jgi:hypothetical protein